MKAHILSIGSELMQGHLTDTNATWLAQELAALGIDLVRVTQVGDDRRLVTDAFRAGLEAADLVIATGGVGPTEDDLTREAIADAIGETPQVDPALLEDVRAFFTARGLEMPERNAKQAWLVPSAEALPNPVGTAPGWYVRTDGRIVVAMPGVPREMKRMWAEQARPRIVAVRPGRVVRGVTLKSIGIGESAAEQEIADLVARENPVIATYAKDDGVHIRVTGFGESEASAEGARAAGEAAVRAKLGQYIYGIDDEPLADAILRPLADRGELMGIIDRGAGGRLASLLGTSALAPATVSGALLRYAGAESAADLAAEARATWPGAIGFGVTVDGVAPGAVGEGVIEFALVLADGTVRVERFPVRSSHDDIQRRSGLFGADVLFRALRDQPATS